MRRCAAIVVILLIAGVWYYQWTHAVDDDSMECPAGYWSQCDYVPAPVDFHNYDFIGSCKCIVPEVRERHG